MKLRRLFPLALVATLVATPAFAFEVLVLTTPTLIRAARNRSSVLVQNQGPNSIWCATYISTDATSTKGVEVPTKQAMSIDAPASASLYCSTASVNQVAGAGTRVIEL